MFQRSVCRNCARLPSGSMQGAGRTWGRKRCRHDRRHPGCAGHTPDLSYENFEYFRRDRLEQELLSWIAKAWNAGLFVAVAAGNNGPAPDSVSAMGLQAHVISVGCHDGRQTQGHKNACAAYSGRGPANGRVKKPDLVAPGSGIVSCNAWYRKNHFCSVNHPYTAKNGTSMAVPAVSAAAALLWEKEPHLTNEQVRERLLYHAQDLGENWGMQGWGMLHVGRALKG